MTEAITRGGAIAPARATAGIATGLDPPSAAPRTGAEIKTKTSARPATATAAQPGTETSRQPQSRAEVRSRGLFSPVRDAWFSAVTAQRSPLERPADSPRSTPRQGHGTTALCLPSAQHQPAPEPRGAAPDEVTEW